MLNAASLALCDSISDTIKDYRSGEIPRPDRVHVAKWVGQFAQNYQFGVLTQMSTLLENTYITKANMEAFLSGLVTNEKLLAGNDPKTFWPTVNFLDIQDQSQSQRDILAMFATTLQATLGISLSQCGVAGGPYVYLDDVSFSGQRIRIDLCKWIEDAAPRNAVVHVILGASHTGGSWYAEKEIGAAAVAQNKTINLSWWRVRELEDRSNFKNTSDLFLPSSLPDTVVMKTYVAGLKYPPPLRDAGQMGECKVFDGEAGRNLLEQQFLEAGLRIRSVCHNLPATQRLLGYASTNSRRTLGFGSTVVTFRNCPNNCPLAFWVGNPWYALFPRKINVKKSGWQV